MRVTGFHNSSPQLAFICRRNVVLTVNIDKNTERDLQKAVEEGVQTLHLHDSFADLVDFTSFADISSTTSSSQAGHYVIIWELNTEIMCEQDEAGTRGSARLDHGSCEGDEEEEGGKLRLVDKAERGGRRLVEESVLKRCATSMDLAFVDPGYVGSRKAGTIGALELCVVEAGTFRYLVDRYLAKRGTAITQYKTPRCIASLDLRSILRSKVSASAFSSAYL